MDYQDTDAYNTKQPPCLTSVLSLLRDFSRHHFLRLWANERSRYIAIGSVCVVAFLLWATSSGSSYRLASIQRVLAADIQASRDTKSVAEVANRMRAISLSGCPSDFSSAYLAHVHAWERAADVEREALQYNEMANSGEAMLMAFMRGLVFDFGTMREASEARERLMRAYSTAMADVRLTYQHVEQVAVGDSLTAQLPERTIVPAVRPG